MRICKIWDSEYPWDVRVQKVARTLTQQGHDVHLVARNRRADPLVERLPEATVHRLASWAWASPRVNALSSFPAFFNPRWLSRIEDTARESRADLLMVRDLPLAPAAIWVARRLGRPVMLDMAENYGAMMQAVWDGGVQRPMDFLVRNPRIIRRLERWVLANIDHVLVVVEESRDRLQGLGMAGERITVVGNTPERSRLAETPEKVHTASPTLRVVYLGLLERPRGVEVTLRALALCRDRGVRVHLTVIGDGRERRAFEALAGSLALGDAEVTFLGYVPYARAVTVLNDADVGLVPHLANESWNSTIPNKLFDYMASGLAVVTSDAKPAARVVRETGCGRVYADRDPEALAKALTELGDVDTRRDCGARGRAAIAGRYNWDHDAQRLGEALRAIHHGARASTN